MVSSGKFILMKAKVSFFANKIKLTVFWNVHRIILIYYLGKEKWSIASMSKIQTLFINHHTHQI